MKKPILVIMAAGMGSRYGGLKQMDPIDNEGHFLIDFSIYDAVLAGFERVVFIIKKAIEQDFKQTIGNRISKTIQVDYIYQELDCLPEGISVPEGRIKPWGTGHAVLCCKDVVDAPFAVINADDYYGRDAFERIYQFLIQQGEQTDVAVSHYAMVGYLLKNTLTEHGHVARGVCQVDENQMLTMIQERTHIEKCDGAVAFTEDGGVTWENISPESTVSMNLWGFTPSLFDALERRFVPFLTKNLVENPLKCEYFLPTVISELIDEQKATVNVLTCTDRWYGVTYQQDKQMVIDAIEEKKKAGVYPQQLWK